MIEGSKVNLRVLQLDDAETLAKHWNDLDVRRFVGYMQPCSKKDEEDFIKRCWSEAKDKSAYTFGIEHKNKLIGTVSLRKIDWLGRSAELGVSIFRKSLWGKGLGTEAVELILEYGFRWLNLRHVWLRVFDFNERAIACYKKAGFREAGRLRKNVYKDGEYHDSIVMDVLRQDG